MDKNEWIVDSTIHAGCGNGNGMTRTCRKDEKKEVRKKTDGGRRMEMSSAGSMMRKQTAGRKCLKRDHLRKQKRAIGHSFNFSISIAHHLTTSLLSFYSDPLV